MKRSEMLKQIQSIKEQAENRLLTRQQEQFLTQLGLKAVNESNTAYNKNDQKNNKEEYLLSIVSALTIGQISLGMALKKMRKELLGLSQDQYAKLIGLSRKTISDIENDKDNYTIHALDTMCKPFGLRISLIPNRK